MRNHVLVLTTSAVILACGGAASAQAPGAQSPSTQQSPTTQPTPGGPMMQQQDQTIRERLREQLQERAQRGEEEDSDQDGYRYRGKWWRNDGKGNDGPGLRVPRRGSRSHAFRHGGPSHDDANDFQSDGR